MSKHFINKKRESVPSLLSLCLDNVIARIEMQHEELMFLPPHIKTRILKRLCSKTNQFSNIKGVYKMLVHSQLNTIDLSSLEIDNEFLVIISHCHNLNKLILTRSRNETLTEAGLQAVLPNFKKLIIFHAAHCIAVSDAVISTLVKNCPQMCEVDLFGCSNISDNAMFELATLENLSAINISKTKVTSEGIIRLAEGPSGPKLKELRIAECRGVDHKAMHVICEKCKLLEVFIFYNCKEIRDVFCIDSENSNFKNLKQLTWSVYW